VTDALLLAGGGLVAAAVSGATGFGFALVANALWSHRFDAAVVTPLALVFMGVLNIGYLPFFARHIPWRRLMPFAVGGVLGVPAGAWALHLLPAATLRPVLGALLLAYGLFMLRRGHPLPLALSPRTARWADAGVGLVGGFLGGLAGLSGVLPTLWLARRGGGKDANRALVQAYLLLTAALAIACHGGLGGLDAPLRERLWLGLPFVVAGGALGLWLFSRMDAARFHRVVLWLLAVCGALLLLRAWTG
jgi:uncharacterized membrane protein YfcA